MQAQGQVETSGRCMGLGTIARAGMPRTWWAWVGNAGGAGEHSSPGDVEDCGLCPLLSVDILGDQFYFPLVLATWLLRVGWRRQPCRRDCIWALIGLAQVRYGWPSNGKGRLMGNYSCQEGPKEQVEDVIRPYIRWI